MEGVMSSVRAVMFQPPPSLLVAAMSVVGVVSLGNAGVSELRGKHMKYSKFSDQPSASTSTANSSWSSIPSRTGMLVAYTPAFLAALASLLFLHHGHGGVEASSSRLLLVESALALHFFKRVLETLFVHKFSGTVAAGTAIPISLSYFTITALTIYTQFLTQEALLPEPAVDLKLYGVVLFIIGIAGNYYHHYLLSKLRSNDGGKKKEYKIPKGGMFELVICPHYLFEILGFYGIALISQTIYSFCVAVGTSLYLMGRSKATREWYLSKFDDFPPHVKCIIPFVF
ncbi:unnamed protein product [Linum trigynum]|uniref:3-oxo-5-alpha-steroid 4-dehydrogenase C-terminal domain-containing protein n=1 Tax=Linum trigynum TaxID=586398 RepID=A0AAV2DJJ2_9ROSI